jgi:hypothetical protein
MSRWPLYQLLVFWLAICLPDHTKAQASVPLRTPEEFGYRHLVLRVGADSVHLLVLSAPGEAQVRKPLLLWAQGSLPMPLVLYDQRGAYPVFPFHPKAVLKNCHLAIISKPGIPLVANVEGKDPNQLFRTSPPPAYYCARNYLGYYVRRDEAVLRYLSGSPLGRALTEVARDPFNPDTTAADVEQGFAKWQRAVANPTQNDCVQGDSPQNTYSHGQSELPYLLRAQVPLFIGYGTRDAAVVANDYLRLEAMRCRSGAQLFRL